jgi:hypothetical protein
MDAEKAEQTSGESTSLSAGAVVSEHADSESEPGTAKAVEIASESVQTPSGQAPADIESPRLVPEEMTLVEMPSAGSEAAKVDAEKVEDVHETGPSKAEAPVSGKLIVLSSRPDWEDHAAESQAGRSGKIFGRRRIAALAAVLVLATVAGGLAGAISSAALVRGMGGGAPTGSHALEASVARIDADVLALKSGLENNSRIAMSRLDRIEKAQAEPAARLARLSEAVERLHAAPVPLLTPPAVAVPSGTTIAAKDVTGSVSPQTASTKPEAKPEIGRLPTVEGWVLRDVAYGGALIQSRRGLYEVYAGDPVPGLGRIDAIRRQDGRWVVVTSRGLIVAR